MGETHVKAGFRASSRRRFPGWLAVFAVFAVLVGLFELIRVIIPFQSINPLWQQVTIGQSVINSWMYGGEDEEGYLRFYSSGGESVVLPPSSHLFTADGTFVVLEHYSPSTLTFAQPWDAIPTGWLAGGFVVLVFGGYILVRRGAKRSRVRGPFRVNVGGPKFLGGGFRSRTSRNTRFSTRRSRPASPSRSRPRSSRDFRPTTRSRWIRPH